MSTHSFDSFSSLISSMLYPVLFIINISIFWMPDLPQLHLSTAMTTNHWIFSTYIFVSFSISLWCYNLINSLYYSTCFTNPFFYNVTPFLETIHCLQTIITNPFEPLRDVEINNLPISLPSSGHLRSSNHF